MSPTQNHYTPVTASKQSIRQPSCKWCVNGLIHIVDLDTDESKVEVCTHRAEDFVEGIDAWNH